jgi:hypothetical protein
MHASSPTAARHIRGLRIAKTILHTPLCRLDWKNKKKKNTQKREKIKRSYPGSNRDLEKE